MACLGPIKLKEVKSYFNEGGWGETQWQPHPFKD